MNERIEDQPEGGLIPATRMPGEKDSFDVYELGTGELPDAEDGAPTAWTTKVDYDNAQHAIARRSERLAKLIDENYAIADAMLFVLRGVQIYCDKHGLPYNAVEVNGKMTPTGVIALEIHERGIAR